MLTGYETPIDLQSQSLGPDPTSTQLSLPSAPGCYLLYIYITQGTIWEFFLPQNETSFQRQADIFIIRNRELPMIFK